MNAPAMCASCGGSYAHHQNDRACWCPKCMSGPSSDRCTNYSPTKPKEPIDRNVAHVAMSPQPTSAAAAKRTAPRTGTLRRAVYDHLVTRGALGATDDEMERHLGKSHQSVSGARNSLASDEHIVDSGARRLTRHGSEAIVWTISDLTVRDVNLPTAEPAVSDELDLTPPASVEFEGEHAHITDGPVRVSLHWDADQPVAVTLDGHAILVLRDDHADLWQAVTDPDVSVDTLTKIAADVMGAVHALSAALKGTGR